MEVMVEGMVIDPRRVETALPKISTMKNIAIPILVNPFTNVTSLRDVQGENTSSPIYLFIYHLLHHEIINNQINTSYN